MARKKILVITGPTASGKSELGVELALKLGGEVISADSRQIYRGLDIGTGKITRREMKGVPHHLLDVARPQTRFSASDYKKLGEKALDEILAKDKLPLVVGGTGFYIDILSCTINFPEVPPNPALRKHLEKQSPEKLFAMLKKKDPIRAKEVDPHNKRRIIRALEIVEVLGKVPKLKRAHSPYEFVYIGLMPEDLDEKIRARLDKRMQSMIAEAKRLHEKGLSYKRMRELGLEYRYLALYLSGKMGKEEMREKLYGAIRQYAKRQMTWFKRNKKIRWFKPDKYKTIEKYLQTKL